MKGKGKKKLMVQQKVVIDLATFFQMNVYDLHGGRAQAG